MFHVTLHIESDKLDRWLTYSVLFWQDMYKTTKSLLLQQKSDCIGCDSRLPKASSFRKLRFAVKCCIEKLTVKIGWSGVAVDRRNPSRMQMATQTWVMRVMIMRSRCQGLIWTEMHWAQNNQNNQNTSSTRSNVVQSNGMFGVFEARLAEARWCAGAIHVVLPDPNNGNTDMNIHLKLKRHQHSNLSVKH